VRGAIVVLLVDMRRTVSVPCAPRAATVPRARWHVLNVLLVFTPAKPLQSHAQHVDGVSTVPKGAVSALLAPVGNSPRLVVQLPVAVAPQGSTSTEVASGTAIHVGQGAILLRLGGAPVNPVPSVLAESLLAVNVHKQHVKPVVQATTPPRDGQNAMDADLGTTRMNRHNPRVRSALLASGLPAKCIPTSGGAVAILGAPPPLQRRVRAAILGNTVASKPLSVQLV
jgi:hypothetical protein